MWTQIVGKIRLARSPWINHSWHVTLYVTTRGLTTSPIPYGNRTFQIDFDFIGQQITIASSDGGVGGFSLRPQSVAAFYRRLKAEMAKLGLDVKINRKPNEITDPIPFDQDESHKAAVREAGSPDDTLLDFLQMTYEAAADLANWDRNFLERKT